MQDNDRALALLGIAAVVGGYYIARGAFGGKQSKALRAGEEDEFVAAHYRAAGWREPEQTVMQEVVALGVIFLVGTQSLVTAADWALKQAGR
jgi:hypothetical protein